MRDWIERANMAIKDYGDYYSSDNQYPRHDVALANDIASPYVIDAAMVTANTVYTAGKIDMEAYLRKNVFNDKAKFNEPKLLEELIGYLSSTYKGHYGGQVQPLELIDEDRDRGLGFATGNVIKYAARYGKKNGFNRDDLLKVVHYGLLALYVHDKFNNGVNN